MDYFDFRDGELHAEDVPLSLIAGKVGTPCYVYSRATIERHYRAFDTAFGDHPHLICYAVKANANLAVLDVLARLGGGFDIVSGGELARVLRAGGDPGRVVFSGVGKGREEMRQALEAGIHCFNVESEAELDALEAVAADLRRRAPVSLRVNPDVDPRTHPYIATGLHESKFGIPIDQAARLYRDPDRWPHLRWRGVACHIGSQLTEVAPFVDALERVLDLVEGLAADGLALEQVDIGGGLGIRYRDERPPTPAQYAAAVLAPIRRRAPGLRLLIEPGRAIAGNAGVLLTRVRYLKATPSKAFAVVDAAMNDLMRPSLYGAWQAIVPVRPRAGPARPYDIVGPVCETGDFLGKDRNLAIAPGDLLAVRSAGAYGAVMASNYNARPRPAEVMVDGGRHQVVRRRESLDDLMAGESTLE